MHFLSYFCGGRVLRFRDENKVAGKWWDFGHKLFCSVVRVRPF